MATAETQDLTVPAVKLSIPKQQCVPMAVFVNGCHIDGRDEGAVVRPRGPGEVTHSRNSPAESGGAIERSASAHLRVGIPKSFFRGALEDYSEPTARRWARKPSGAEARPRPRTVNLSPRALSFSFI